MEDTNKFGLVDKEGIKALLKEFQYLNDEILSKIDNKEDDGLLQKLSIVSNKLGDSLHNNEKILNNSKILNKEIRELFQKLQDAKNLKLEIENLKLNFVSRKEFDDLTQLVKYMNGFKSFMSKKATEINDAYLLLNKQWFEEDEVLKRIEKIENSLLTKIFLGGIGVGVILTLIVVIMYKNSM